MVNNDVLSLAPDPSQLTLRSGVIVEVVPLRFREILKFVKIVTNGAGPILGNLFSGDKDDDEWVGELIGVMLASMPNAEQETISFIEAMVKPAGLIERSNLNKQDKERNEALWDAVWENTYNPDPGDVLNIVERILTQEADNFKSLGKQVMTMIKAAQKTSPSSSPASNSSGGSAERSISSVPNTGGETTTSSNSPSEEPDKSSQQSPKRGRTKKETVAVL